MFSSGAGAFGVSSAMNQPPGFADSPEGTSPDQGRNRRAKVWGLLKPLRAEARGRDATAVRLPNALLVRLDNQASRGSDLGHRRHLEPRPKPSPALAARGGSCEA